MKTMTNLPHDLFAAARRRAAEERTTLSALVERALRDYLGWPRNIHKRVALRWVTVDGGLPPGIDLADRAAMHDRVRRVKR